MSYTELWEKYRVPRTEDYNCRKKSLYSLTDAPHFVHGYFDCSANYIMSLEGGPFQVKGDFTCTDNALTSLQGAPSSVRNFNCSSNKITSLHGIGKDYLQEVKGMIYMVGNPIRSHVLGLLKVKGLEKVLMNNLKVEEIINKYIKEGRQDIISCQEELLDAGLGEYAKL